MSEIYDIGDRVTLTANFTDAGAPVEPTTVTCSVRSPSGTTTSPSVTNASGTYSAEIEPDEHGAWAYRFAGTGTYVAAEEGTFRVRRRQVA